MTNYYKTDVIHEKAVRHYYVIAWVASVFAMIPLGIAGVASGVDGRWLMLFLALEQNVSWLVIGGLMCAQFKLLSTPPASPTPPIKTVTSSNKVTGNGGVTEVERIKTYER